MFCIYCGKEIPEESRFCIYCGKEMPVRIHASYEEAEDRQASWDDDVTEMGETASAAYREPVREERAYREAAREERAYRESVREESAYREPARQRSRDTYERQTYAEPADQRRVSAAAVPVRSAAFAPAQAGQALDPYSLPTRNPSGIRSIYMFDFFARMLQRQNIPTLIYLFLNYLIVSGILLGFFGLPVVWALVAGFIAYAASVALALSPLGEMKLRKDVGATKIVDPDLVRRLDPLFREVYYRAKKANPSISADVRLYMTDDDSENAFATGRKTICITRGILRRSDEELKAILGHEFGHLAHRDTDRLLVVAIGNTFISLFFTMVEIGIWITDIIMSIFAIFSEDGIFILLFSTLNRIISILFIRSILKIWTWIGCMLCMKTSRGNEYQADEFSWYLGYGRGLLHFFNSVHEGKPKGLFANLALSHPVAADRVDHLMELDAA